MRVQREVALHSKAHSLLRFKNVLDDSWSSLHVPGAGRIIEDKAVTHMGGITGID